MKNQKLIIIGAGEFALIAYEYFQYDSEYEVVAFSVEKEYIETDTLNNLPVIPFETIEEHFPPSEYKAYVAVTFTKLNRVRTRLYHEAKNKGYQFANYISSKAFMWKNAEIGENCFIFENNVVQPFVKIGNNVVLWSGNHVGHRAEIKDNCFISSHVVISGYCTVGENTFIGVNTTIADNVNIGKDCLIGAGCIILKDTKDAQIFKGNASEPSNVSSLRYFKLGS